MLAQHVILVGVVAACGVEVDLLEQNKIGIERFYGLRALCNASDHALLTFGAGLGAAVHKETEVLFISAKADVIGHDGIRCVLLHLGEFRALCVILCRQGRVTNTIVSRQHIDHICVALMKNNRKQTEQLESLFRQELKENREELSRNMRELRTELNQAISLSTQQMQTTLHRNLMTTNEMQREKFEAMNRQQDILVKSTEKRLDEMRLMVEEKLQKTLNERIGQSFELVRSQLENVQRGLGEMKNLAEDVGGLKKVLGNVKTRGTFGEIQLSALLEQMLSPEQYEANVKTRKNATEFVEFAIKLPGKDNGKDVVYLPIDAKFPKDVYEQYIDAYEEG